MKHTLKILNLFLFVAAFPAFAVECTQLDAADPAVPNVFTSGQPAVAADVNANFDCLADELGELQKIIKTDTGNVGIGTTSPTEKLDVTGNVNISGNLKIGYSKVIADCGAVLECSATCPAGTVILGGGCSVAPAGIGLDNSYPTGSAWECRWKTIPNNSTTHVMCAKLN